MGLSIAFCSVCPLSTQQACRDPVLRGGKLGWGLVAELAYGGGGEAGAQGSEEGCEEGCREGVGGAGTFFRALDLTLTRKAGQLRMRQAREQPGDC